MIDNRMKNEIEIAVINMNSIQFYSNIIEEFETEKLKIDEKIKKLKEKIKVCLKTVLQVLS